MSLDPSLVAGAVWMSFIAMSSLVIGAAIGVFATPSKRTTAIVMAFGTGALIHALAVDLAYEGAERLLHEAHLPGFRSWLWVALGFVAGGVMYHLGNRALERHGAALRHPALTKMYLLRKKHEHVSALLHRLARMDIMRALPPEEMDAVLPCVEEVRYPAGATIFREGDDVDALYMVDSGSVEARVEKGGAPIARLDAGVSFGELALLNDAKRTATVAAVTDVVLLKIPKEAFKELLEVSPRLKQAVEVLGAERIAQNAARLRRGSWRALALANMQRLSRSEEAALLAEHAATGAPLALFLGAMLDGIPESVVIGSSFEGTDVFRFTFLAAVFLSNLPEAMSSAVGMKRAGFSHLRIFTLWSVLIVAGCVAAALGNIFLAGASPQCISVVGAVAGGGILAMVSSVMMPEAYENGGASVGLATIAGFLAALLFTVV